MQRNSKVVIDRSSTMMDYLEIAYCEFGRSKAVEILTIDNVVIENALPLRNFSNLIEIHLNSTETEYLAHIDAVKNLVELDVANNELIKFPLIKSLDCLKKLTLRNCGLSSLEPSSRPYFNSIVSIDLSFNSFPCLKTSFFEGLLLLENINLKKCDIKVIDGEFDTLPSPININFDDNKIEFFPFNLLGSSFKLTCFSAKNNKLITAPIILSPSLSEIYISGNNEITDCIGNHFVFSELKNNLDEYQTYMSLLN